VTITTVTNRDRVTVTLRARTVGDGLVAGALIAAPKGQGAHRVLEVWRVRRAGDQRYALRLVCRRRSRAQVPEGAEVLPWPLDRRAPRGSRRVADRARASADSRHAGIAGSPHRAHPRQGPSPACAGSSVEIEGHRVVVHRSDGSFFQGTGCLLSCSKKLSDRRAVSTNRLPWRSDPASLRKIAVSTMF
jgi:hypothetical protein